MMHDLLTVIVAGACLVAIVSPRLPTGIVGTAGLGIVCVAALWSIDDHHDPRGATDMLLVGLGMLAAQVFAISPREHKQTACCCSKEYPQ